MAEIKLYQFGPIADRESASPFCVKLHYALRYKGLPFEAVNLASPTQVKKYNPRGKLPVLGYDGTLILDSSDVVHYIEQRHPEPRLSPENERERAQALLLEDWADESFYWHVVYENWLIDDQFEKFAAEILAPMPAPLRPLNQDHRAQADSREPGRTGPRPRQTRRASQDALRFARLAQQYRGRSLSLWEGPEYCRCRGRGTGRVPWVHSHQWWPQRSENGPA